MLALLLSDPLSEVVADHSDVSTVVGRVFSGAAKNFSDEFGDVLEMGRVHIPEEGFEDRVGRYLLVEARDERRERFGAAEPFVEGGDWMGHDGFYSYLPPPKSPIIGLVRPDGEA